MDHPEAARRLPGEGGGRRRSGHALVVAEDHHERARRGPRHGGRLACRQVVVEVPERPLGDRVRTAQALPQRWVVRHALHGCEEPSYRPVVQQRVLLVLEEIGEGGQLVYYDRDASVVDLVKRVAEGLDAVRENGEECPGEPRRNGVVGKMAQEDEPVPQRRRYERAQVVAVAGAERRLRRVGADQLNGAVEIRPAPEQCHRRVHELIDSLEVREASDEDDGGAPSFRRPFVSCSRRALCGKQARNGAPSAMSSNSLRAAFGSLSGRVLVNEKGSSTVDQPGLPVRSRRCNSSFTAGVGADLNATSR